jgi:hypothetical protein
LVACAERRRKDKDARFTALLHHVDVGRLLAACLVERDSMP